MNPGSSQPQSNHSAKTSAAIGPEDLLYILFRQKWLILVFIVLGICAAATMRILKPPFYLSKARILLRYVIDPKVARTSHDETGVVGVESMQNVLSTEMDIITSRNTAKRVTTMFPPEKILAHWGNSTNVELATSVVASGVDVEPPRSSILTVTFKHPDPTVVQPVLTAIIQAYQYEHLLAHLGDPANQYGKQLDEWREKLVTADEQLKKLKASANVLYPEETKHNFQEQINKAKADLNSTMLELAEHKAILESDNPPGATNDQANSELAVPREKLTDYEELISDLDKAKAHKKELMRDYKEAHPLVLTVDNQIKKLTEEKAELLQQYPALSGVVISTSSGGGTNNSNLDMASQMREIKRLTARVRQLGVILTNAQAGASAVMDVEPGIAEAQRKRDEAQKNYDYFLKLRETGQELNQMSSISIVEDPTPPRPDYKKLVKLIGMCLGGSTACGLALAALIELLIRRTIKRTADVERHLRLPVFLAIPDTNWKTWLGLPWQGGSSKQPAKNGEAAHEVMAVVPWKEEPELQMFADGLRERLMTYFEVRNLNLKKPKMVAVTGCENGVGVSSLASGLAATLSRAGNGNVLLVDMQGDQQGVMRAFSNGQPSLPMENGFSEAINGNGHEQNLYLESVDGQQDKVPAIRTENFNRIVPRIKTSDYDYVIFDMPPVTPTSATPRLASHMDLTLMVLESERTGQRAAVRATALMREARANVAVVLNKCRTHAPAMIAPES
jgi:uncharacterized protein involved in exopolysaccharide biosynthesis/Mrp family chromosome partitioning ATPase